MLSKEFLIQRGSCCGLGCLMCPYRPKHLKGNQNMTDEKIKPGDYVRVHTVGIDGLYEVIKLEGNQYHLEQSYSDVSTRGHKTKSGYKHRMVVPLEKISKV